MNSSPAFLWREGLEQEPLPRARNAERAVPLYV